MAKNVKQQNGQDGHGVSAIRGNGYDPEAVKGFVDRIENLNGDLATMKGEFMAECKVVHGDIKSVLDEAKNAGIPKKELKQAIKRRALTLKIGELRDELEGEQVDNYDAILLALGDIADTPLGRAAASKAPDAPRAAA